MSKGWVFLFAVLGLIPVTVLEVYAFETLTITEYCARFPDEVSYNAKKKSLQFFETTIAVDKKRESYLVKLGDKEILNMRWLETNEFQLTDMMAGKKPPKVKPTNFVLDDFRVAKDFPAANMASITYFQTRGRFYGFESYIITRTPESIVLCTTVTDSALTPSQFDPTAPPGTLVIFDDAMCRYDREFGKVYFFSSTSTLKNVNRLAVFEGGTWRMDRAGEFPAYYNKLSLEAQEAVEAVKAGNDQLDEIGQAVAIRAYYQIMAGQPADACLSGLRADLPEAIRHIAPAMLTDVVERVRTVAPLTVAIFPVPAGLNPGQTPRSDRTSPGTRP